MYLSHVDRDRIRFAVRRAHRDGAAIVTRVLPDHVVGAWERELAGGPFRPVREHGGLVDQEFDSYTLTPTALDDFPITNGIQEEPSWTVDHCGLEACIGWRPNEIAVQRYELVHTGITPHRDYERDRIVVAVWTLGAGAPFHLHNSYNPLMIRETWQTTAGSLVLLRAPGLTGRDDRPYHSIEAPTDGRRISVGMRYNSVLGV